MTQFLRLSNFDETHYRELITKQMLSHTLQQENNMFVEQEKQKLEFLISKRDALVKIIEDNFNIYVNMENVTPMDTVCKIYYFDNVQLT